MYPRLCVARKGAWKEEKGKERREREERKKKKSPSIRGHVSGVIGRGKRRREKKERIEE